MKHNLKNYNLGQQELFKIFKQHSYIRNKLNKRVNKAIEDNDVFALITHHSTLMNEIIKIDKEAHAEAQRIVRGLNAQYYSR